MGGAAATLDFGTWAPQKTPPTQAMLDDMYHIHALLKGDKSDLSNADSIKSGTTRLRPEELQQHQDAGVLGNLHQLALCGRHSLPSGTFRATWKNTVDGTTVTQTISSNGGGHSFGVPPSGMGAECVIWVRP
jgi:hypothetical protein